MKNDRTTWVDWDDAKLLQDVINKSKSRTEVLKNLGYYASSISRKKLNCAIKKFNLDVSRFTNKPERWNRLPELLKDCYCLADVIRAVGLTDQGDNHKTAKRYIKEMGLDISHFDMSKIRSERGGTVSPYKFNDIFCKNSNVHRTTVKKKILKENLIPYMCSECNNGGIWNGKELILQLDHKNGINNDNRLKNLRFLCPNCHTQTSTYGQKKRGC